MLNNLCSRKDLHCKDFINDNLEAAWIQVNFPSCNTLFGVVYRLERLSNNVFGNLHFTLEKALNVTAGRQRTQ